MTEFLDIEGGRIAYNVTGDGPLIVLSHGIGDRRQAFRYLVPELVQAGFRVAAADMRGHGESSIGGWKSISRSDVAGDLVALIRHLGGPAVIVGHSLSGGAATIAAATEPDLVSGVVEVGPFTRKVQYSLGGLLQIRRYRAQRDGVDGRDAAARPERAGSATWTWPTRKSGRLRRLYGGTPGQAVQRPGRM